VIELEVRPLGEPREPRLIHCEAMLLDMDGTLVDSGGCVERIWRTWALHHGLDGDAIMRVAHGRQNHETVRAVAPHLDRPQEYAWMVRAEEGCRDGIVAVDGAPELLAALPPERWAVVTSAWRRLAAIRLTVAGLPMPRVLISADDVRRSKPSPDGYLAAAAALGVDARHCVVIEDAPAGVAAATAAGTTVIGITINFEPDALPTSLHIGDLRAVRVVAHP
jgi:sugar-phosphatase